MKRLLVVLASLFTLVSAAGIVNAATLGTPKLVVKTLAGKSFDLSAQRGKWVIVNYWATWCHPCVKEMPEISRFVQSHDDVTAIGLAYQDADRVDLERFLKKHPVSYPVSQVDTQHPPADFGAPLGLPTTFVIAPDGTLAKKFVGPISTSDLVKLIGAKKS